MIILIGIGYYQEAPQNSTEYFPNLEVDIDVRKLLDLFSKFNYKIYPSYPNPSEITIEWTKNDLIQLLEKQANILENEVKNNTMDGLIVVISAHGMDDSIVTSDYKQVKKNVIHRIFSAHHPISREIPRIFLFDSCAGDDEKIKGISEQKDAAKVKDNRSVEICESKQNHNKTQSIHYKYKHAEWKGDQKNPDYRLANLNATNPGFQSKMNTTDGSYMISAFVEKTVDYLENGKNIPFLGDIFEEIQKELCKDKQLPVYIWNNQTERIKLKVNKKLKSSQVMNEDKKNQIIEMSIQKQLSNKVNDIALQMSRSRSCLRQDLSVPLNDEQDGDDSKTDLSSTHL